MAGRDLAAIVQFDLSPLLFDFSLTSTNNMEIEFLRWAFSSGFLSFFHFLSLILNIPMDAFFFFSLDFVRNFLCPFLSLSSSCVSTKSVYFYCLKWS